MRLPAQEILPGVLEKAYHRELERLIRGDVLSRLWAKDISLWPAEAHKESLTKGLTWIDLPERLEPLLNRVVSRASEIESAGFEDVVFVALGDSGLAAETVLQLPSAKLGKRTFLLENVDADCIRALEEKLHLEKTLFIFASKRGKDIDAHSLLIYFLDRLRLLGVPSPQNHFVVLAEEDSYLGQLAAEHQFIDHFLDPPGIPGRFSSLIHFNFFLAALGHLDSKDLLARTALMRDACSPASRGDKNPALALAAFLVAGEVEHLDHMVFFSPKQLLPVAQRIGSLVGASTCKGGRGVIPAFGDPAYSPELLRRGALVVRLKMGGEEDPVSKKKFDELRKTATPVATVELQGHEDLGAELFKWEVATALACSRFGVNPFLDPDTRASRARATELLEQYREKHQLPLRTVRVREAGIDLYAEGETRRELSTLNMVEALRSFFALRRQGSYVALLPFMDMSPERSAILYRIRDHLEVCLGVSVLATSGPKYLRTLAQVYHGGPAKGLFVFVTADPAKDLVVPGADYSFGRLQMALALGEFDVLCGRGRPVIRLHLASGVERGLEQVESILNSALGKRHTAAS